MPAAQLIYLVSSPLMLFVKVGRWKGSVSSLKKRYQTYYPKFNFTIFQCLYSVEAEVLVYLKGHGCQVVDNTANSREIFDNSASIHFINFMQNNATVYDYCEHEDLIASQTRPKPAPKHVVVSKSLVGPSPVKEG